MKHVVGCTGNRSYETFPVADRMARNTMRHRDLKGAPVAAFKCKHCNLFHVGESRRKRRPRQEDDR